MREALQVEWNSDMNSPTAITYSGFPASVISDPAWTEERARTRRVFQSVPRNEAMHIGAISKPERGRMMPTRTEALGQNILQELFLTSRKKFVRIAHRILGNNEYAEYAVQDAFLSACRHFREFEGRSALPTWFTVYLRHECRLDGRRKRKNARCSFHETDEAMSFFAETAPDTRPNPELAYSRAEACEILKTHLQELSPLLREAVVRTYYDELSIAEASSALGVTPGTMKARLFRGRRLLHERATRKTRANFDPAKEADPAIR